MMRFTSLTQRFAVWFVAVSLLPILIIGYTLMRTFETEMEQTAIRQVSAIADMKAEQIDSYLRERLWMHESSRRRAPRARRCASLPRSRPAGG